MMIGGTAAGGALVAGAGIGWMGRTASGAAVLSRIELTVLEVVAEVLFPPGIFPVAGGDGYTSQEVDRLLSDVVEPTIVGPFRSMLGALEWGTLVSRGSRFSVLTIAERKEVLNVWASENPMPRRMAFESLQALLSMAFFRRPEVLEATGWRAGCFG